MSAPMPSRMPSKSPSKPPSQAVRQIQLTVRQVPFGRVASYGQIADLAGLPGRARLVGKALQQASSDQNLPWHRILRADGRLAFPAGSAQAEEQRARLLTEGIVVINHKVSLSEWRWQPDLYEMLHNLSY